MSSASLTSTMMGGYFCSELEWHCPSAAQLTGILSGCIKVQTTYEQAVRECALPNDMSCREVEAFEVKAIAAKCVAVLSQVRNCFMQHDLCRIIISSGFCSCMLIQPLECARLLQSCLCLPFMTCDSRLPSSGFVVCA